MNKKIEVLHKSMERLTKVALIKLEKQQHIETINILNDINNIYFKFFECKRNNRAQFIKIFIDDPAGPSLLYKIQNTIFEFLGAYVDAFLIIWKEGSNKGVEGVTSKTIQIFSKGFNKYLSDYLPLSEPVPSFFSEIEIFLSFFRKLSREIEALDNPKHIGEYNYPFSWYFDFVFDENFDLKKHIFEFQKSLFLSMRDVLIKNNKATYKAFIETIINGFWHPEYGLLPDLDYNAKFSDEENFKEYNKIKNNLITKSLNALTLNDFHEVEILLDNFSVAINNFQSVSEEIRENIISEYNKFVNKQFKYNILKQTVLWIGTYCLFLKQYEYIDILFYFNQPKDSPVDWVNKDINPLTIDEIFTLYHRRFELEKNITFLWDAHHEFMSYYNTFIGLLLINAINQNHRKGKTWQNEYNPDYISSGKTPQEIEDIAHSFDNIQNIVKSLISEKTILKKCGLTENVAEQATGILTTILSNIERQKQEIKVTAEIDPIKAMNYIDSVYNRYLNAGPIRNIINLYNVISSNNEPFSGKKYLPFGINEISIKSFFAKNDEGNYFGWGEAYARQLIFSENIELRRILIGSSNKLESKVDKSKTIEVIDNKIGNLNDKVLIFSNLFPSYTIFSNSPEFIPVEKIPEQERIPLHEFVGTYRGASVFTYFDETKWESLLVLKIFKDDGIGTIKYYVPTDETGFNVKEHFYWKILDLNVESQIIDTLINDQPYWLIQETPDKNAQRMFLQSQVNIIIKYRLGFDLPKDFQGWYFGF